MRGFVKNVFTFLMWVTVAWLMYLALFGTYSFSGRDITGNTAYTGNMTQTTRWKGVLWNAALAVEAPISKYYYEFCLVPNIHAGDYLDSALGGHRRYDLFETASTTGTPTDLSGSDSDMYDMSSAADWSTDWR